MVSEKRYERKVWSNADRLHAGEAILDSGDPRQAMRELMRQYKLQPYQVYAWIGQAAMARAVDARGMTEIRAPRVTTRPRAPQVSGENAELTSALRTLTDILSKRAT